VTEDTFRATSASPAARLRRRTTPRPARTGLLLRSIRNPAQSHGNSTDGGLVLAGERRYGAGIEAQGRCWI